MHLSLHCHHRYVRAQERCVKVEVDVLGSRHNKPTVSVDVKQHFNNNNNRSNRAQELCESRGGRPGLSSLINLRFLWT